jgi:rubredoxin
MKKLEKCLYEKNKQIDQLVKSMGNMNNNKEVPPKKSFKCTKCDYETNSQSGLKVHDTKKHTSVDNVKFPKKCDLYEKEIKSATEMKKHIKRHSYKQAKFECDDCDFVGESDLTMEVHIEKQHSEKYECGLCIFI